MYQKVFAHLLLIGGTLVILVIVSEIFFLQKKANQSLPIYKPITTPNPAAFHISTSPTLPSSTIFPASTPSRISTSSAIPSPTFIPSPISSSSATPKGLTKLTISPETNNWQTLTRYSTEYYPTEHRLKHFLTIKIPTSWIIAGPDYDHWAYEKATDNKYRPYLNRLNPHIGYKEYDWEHFYYSRYKSAYDAAKKVKAGETFKFPTKDLFLNRTVELENTKIEEGLLPSGEEYQMFSGRCTLYDECSNNQHGIRINTMFPTKNGNMVRLNFIDYDENGLLIYKKALPTITLSDNL